MKYGFTSIIDGVLTMSNPTWKDFPKTISFPPLQKGIAVDVAIIGGGLAGVLTAYLLSKKRRKVALLESREIGSGATGLTTAFLTQSLDTDPSDLESMYGRKQVREVYKSHAFGIDLLEKIARKEGISCEFTRCSNYIYAQDHKEYKHLKEEAKVLKKLGVECKLHDKALSGAQSAGYLDIPDQAKFHPLRFLYGLAERLKHKGVAIYEETKVEKISDNGRILLETPGGNVSAKEVVIASYDPVGNPKETFAKKGMYVTYVCEVQIPSGMLQEGIYEDMHNPYHYFRIDPDDTHDRMIAGGEDHRAELPVSENKSFAALEEYIGNLLGSKVPYSIVRKWTGPILEPTDGLALIGEYKPDHAVAAAFSGNGMTYAAITAAMLSGEAPRSYDQLYNPRRIPTPKQLVKKGIDYIEEFAHGAVRNTFRKTSFE
ncbi:MAG TPA: FAD-binding oxidoreductase [Patescibacteria group bacterium]|nr:FAD-binding oxidoreductase [Patescibacteria group bacterium]